MKTAIRNKILFLAGIFAAYALIFSHITFFNYHTTGEPLEDFFMLQYYVASILNGTLPLWDPFNNNGQPFIIHSLFVQYSPIHTISALALKLAWFFIRFNINHAVKFILFVYMTVFTAGLYKFYGYFSETKNKTIPLFIAFAACFAYAAAHDNFGLYITPLQIYTFVPFCLYYTCRYIDGGEPGVLLRLIFYYVLFICHAGAYAVPISLILLTYAAALISAATKEGKSRLLDSLTANKGVILAFLVMAAAALLYKFYVYRIELPKFTRIGRDLENISFAQFLNAKQGPWGFRRLACFLPGVSLFYTGPLSLFFFLYGVAGPGSFKKYLPHIATLLFAGSVCAMQTSPFLILYYVLLFPFLRKIMYWGVIYDTLIIFYMLFVSIGIERFAASTQYKAKAGAVAAAALYLWFGYKCANILIPASFVALLAAKLYFTAAAKRKNILIGLSCGLISLEIGAHYLLSFKHIREVQRVFYGSESVFDGTRDLGYIFYAKRSLHRKQKFECWGFSLPLITRTATYYPWNSFLMLKNQELCDRLLDIGNKKLKYGMTDDMIRTDLNFAVVRSSGEMAAALKADPGRDFLLVPDSAKAEEIAKAAGPVAAGTKRAYTVEYFDPNVLRFKVEAAGPGVVYYADAYDKNWRVKINGVKDTVYLANCNFKAVFLPHAGSYEIEFRYFPKVFVFLFLLSNISIAGMILYIYRIERRHRFRSGIFKM
ncbi:MAG: hypothetical protein NTX59_12945 [Elusimicrobia bacterium]|nr:hypothetical protein [Elusimicrobiota bacterium]